MANKFWIGDELQDWDDPTAWSLSSGGPNNTGIPVNGDRVFFDANSIEGSNTSVPPATVSLLSIDTTGIGTPYYMPPLGNVTVTEYVTFVGPGGGITFDGIYGPGVTGTFSDTNQNSGGGADLLIGNFSSLATNNAIASKVLTGNFDNAHNLGLVGTGNLINGSDNGAGGIIDVGNLTDSINHGTITALTGDGTTLNETTGTFITAALSGTASNTASVPGGTLTLTETATNTGTVGTVILGDHTGSNTGGTTTTLRLVGATRVGNISTVTGYDQTRFGTFTNLAVQGGSSGGGGGGPLGGPEFRL